MKKLLPFFSALWLLLLLFPLVPGSFAQTLSGGTEVKVRLLEQLDSSETKPGQLFSATVAEPVISGKRTILTRGTAVQGRVTDVIRPGRLHQPASFTLQLTNIIGTRVAGGLQAQ